MLPDSLHFDILHVKVQHAGGMVMSGSVSSSPPVQIRLPAELSAQGLWNTPPLPTHRALARVCQSTRRLTAIQAGLVQSELASRTAVWSSTFAPGSSLHPPYCCSSVQTGQ